MEIIGCSFSISYPQREFTGQKQPLHPGNKLRMHTKRKMKAFLTNFNQTQPSDSTTAAEIHLIFLTNIRRPCWLYDAALKRL